MTETTAPSSGAFEALAELAEGLADPKLRQNPREIPGFDRLPENLQSAVLEMDLDARASLGRLHRQLLDAGSFVQLGRLRLSMF